MSRFEPSKKKSKKNKNITLVLLFSVTFIMTLFLVGTMFKNFSPPVDVNIGGEELAMQNNDDGDDEAYIEGEIDGRLKWIQFEDNMSESPVVNEVSSDKEKKQNNKIVNTEIKKNIKKAEALEEIRPNTEKYRNYNVQEPPIPIKYNTQPPVPSISDIKNVSQNKNVAIKMTKVYIGYYSTQEEANKAKDRVLSITSGYQPYVKKVGSNYIVQVGSFSDRTKAVNVKMELSDKGLPARLLTE